jgi:hypothetical protein
MHSQTDPLSQPQNNRESRRGRAVDTVSAARIGPPLVGHTSARTAIPQTGGGHIDRSIMPIGCNCFHLSR